MKLDKDIMPTNFKDVHLSISDDLSKDIMTTIVAFNVVALGGPVSIFGIASNAMNILVFCKQGFSETTNISYTALAISDLLSLVASLFLSIFWNPLFLNAGLPIVFVDIQAAFATMPYGCFSRITGLVTVFITLERCLCVVWPLKVKRVLTSTITTIFMKSVYLVTFLTMVPIYSTLILGLRSDPRTNRTLLGIIAEEHFELTSFCYSLYSTTQLFAFMAVLFCTVTLIASLRQKASWRRLQTKAQNATKNATKRQDKAIKMVALIAAMYVVGYLPTITSFAVTVLYSNYSPVGRYKNIFFAVWSLVELCGVLNSSANLLVYYHMSSKFKRTCDQILSRLLPERITKDKDAITKTDQKELKVK